MGDKEYRLGYRSDIEGLRAVAILLVVAVHAGVPWLGGGFVGVDVFFVLSGFLITGLLTREISTTGRLRFPDFYVRRLRRLLPALVVMLVVIGGAAALLLAPAEQRGQASAAAMAALWLSNLHFALAPQSYFAAGTETNLFLHTWSLGVEEQFYLAWPALLVWLLGRDGAAGTRRLKTGMFVVIGASLVACVILTYRLPQLAFYMMPLRAWQFATGALVWLYFSAPGPISGRPPSAPTMRDRVVRWLGGLGLALIIGSAIFLNSNMPYPGAWALLPTVGAACVIAAGSQRELAGVSSWLSCKPMQAIGRVSYSWYLWHWPVLLLGHALTGSDRPGWRVLWVLLSLLLAAISYRYVESPIRHQRRWLLRPGAAILGALALMIAVNAGCIRWYDHAAARMQSPAFQRYAMAHADAPVIYAMGCDDWYHSDVVHPCSFGPANAMHTVVLMGDSHAGQWFPAVAEAFDRPGWRLLVLTKSSCPMVDEPVFYARIGREYTECATWREGALQQIAKLKPEVVVLGTADANGFTRKQWMAGTAKVLHVLSPSAGHVYVLRDTPQLPFDGPDCLAEHVGRPAWLGLQHACSAVPHDRHASDIYEWLSQAAGSFKNVSMLDMNAQICPGGTCSAELHGLVVFRDSQHMTASFAASLGTALRSRLAGADSAPSGSGGAAVTPSSSPILTR